MNKTPFAIYNNKTALHIRTILRMSKKRESLCKCTALYSCSGRYVETRIFIRNTPIRVQMQRETTTKNKNKMNIHNAPNDIPNE